VYRRHGMLGALWRHATIWVVMAFALFPVIWVLSASFDPTNSLVSQRLIPRTPSLDNYRQLFQDPTHPFPRWIANSVKVSLLTAALTTALTALAAYAFSRFRFRGRRSGLFVLLLVQVFPQMLAMVAIYLMMLRVGEYLPWLGPNTHAGLIAVYLGGALGVNSWLMKGYFDTIPTSLEESAYIDGASRLAAFWRIILPLSRPILAVIFLLSFVGTYSEYVMARILLSRTDQYTLAIGLQLLISDQYNKRWGIFSAAALLGALPILMLFLLLQRQLISGLTRGAVKE